MIDSREPPNGDFVAFVEKIEREQLARALQTNKPALATAGTTAAEGDAKNRALSATEAQRVLDALKSQARQGKAPLGAMVGVFLGAALIAFGLLAEGGIILVVVGAALLWHNLRRLRAASATVTSGTAAQQVDLVFGKEPAKALRKRGG
jgi:hypothetical protein